ncbi:MAG: FkbM family methyltransferase [Chitinophagaceae bacterium]|nr:FkbM family methyltransferase [Chitinophagaceae bacterium]
MKILDYIKQSLRRKKARRVTQEYPAKIDLFDLKDEGKIDFANWDNPLYTPIVISQKMVDFFKQFIKKGDLVIDIGANIGDTTVPMALAAGPAGIALGFDPNPYVYKILEINATLNKEKQTIVPLPYAITVKEEEFYYVSSEASFSNGGIATTKDSRHGNFYHHEKIKGINLKAFLEENYSDKISGLSFIKIDTEGYDKEIIKSISDLLATYKPTIVAESFGKSTNDEKLELYDVIEKLGYELFYFEDFDIDAKVIKLNNRNEITNWKKTINIYAVPVNRN